jgi:hypothetical protein
LQGALSWRFGFALSSVIRRKTRKAVDPLPICRRFRTDRTSVCAPWSHTARIEDLGPGDFVPVECIAYGDDEMIPKVGLTQDLRLPLQMLICDEARKSSANLVRGSVIE